MTSSECLAVIHQGAANFQKNVETVGGKLVLSSDSLVFTPHAVNVQRPEISVKLAQISKIEMGSTKFLGLLPIFPNAILVHLETGETYRFTVFRRNIWLEKLRTAVLSERGNGRANRETGSGIDS